jgi:hypothetical protein
LLNRQSSEQACKTKIIKLGMQISIHKLFYHGRDTSGGHVKVRLLYVVERVQTSCKMQCSKETDK